MPKKAPTFNPLDTSEYPNRVFKNMFVSVVGGFIFEVMHRMEGKWSGLSAVPVGVSLVDGDEMEEEEDAPLSKDDVAVLLGRSYALPEKGGEEVKGDVKEDAKEEEEVKDVKEAKQEKKEEKEEEKKEKEKKEKEKEKKEEEEKKKEEKEEEKEKKEEKEDVKEKEKKEEQKAEMKAEIANNKPEAAAPITHTASVMETGVAAQPAQNHINIFSDDSSIGIYLRVGPPRPPHA